VGKEPPAANHFDSVCSHLKVVNGTKVPAGTRRARLEWQKAQICNAFLILLPEFWILSAVSIPNEYEAGLKDHPHRSCGFFGFLLLLHA